MNVTVSNLIWRENENVICDDDTDSIVMFKSCGIASVYQACFNLTTMQHAAIVRSVFTKTTKKKDPKAIGTDTTPTIPTIATEENLKETEAKKDDIVADVELQKTEGAEDAQKVDRGQLASGPLETGDEERNKVGKASDPIQATEDILVELATERRLIEAVNKD